MHLGVRDAVDGMTAAEFRAGFAARCAADEGSSGARSRHSPAFVGTKPSPQVFGQGWGVRPCKMLPIYRFSRAGARWENGHEHSIGRAPL